MSATVAHPSSPARHLPTLPLLGKLAFLLRIVALALTAAVLTATVKVTGGDLDAAAARVQYVSGPVYLPRAEYLRPMSLGWQNVLADVLWFHTISYFGEHFRNDRTYPWLARMCDLITDLDPRAEHVYRFAGFILPWEADEVDQGIHLLEKGARQFPESWLLEYYIGFNYYFFKDDYVQAIAHMQRAMELPDVHPSVAALVAVLSAEQYGPDTTVAFLSELERTVDSPELRQVVEEKLQEAQLGAEMQRVNAALAAYHDRYGLYPIVVEQLSATGLIDPADSGRLAVAYVIDPLAERARPVNGRTPSRLHQSPMRERLVRGESVRDL